MAAGLLVDHLHWQVINSANVNRRSFAPGLRFGRGWLRQRLGVRIVYNF